MSAKRFLLIILFLALKISSFAQVSLTSTSNTYTENFNSLPNNTSTTNTWSDNSTLSAWYSNRTVIIGGSGTLTNGGLYSWGSTGNSDRAIGSLGSGSAAPLYGVRLVNNGTSAISSISVSYTGEQWRSANSISNTLAFSYAVSTTPLTSITTGTYTNYTALDFVSPNTAAGGAIDGNLTTNKTTISATITVNIPVGSEIMLRWSDVDDSGSDHGLGVDDLTVTANYPCTPPTAAVSGTTSVCSGGSSTITFTGTANATVTYKINGGSNLTVTLNGSGSATVNTGTLSANAVYTLVSANIGSCSQALTGSATITVNSLPTASVSGTTAICSGGNTNINFTGTPNAVITYKINGGANLTTTLNGAGSATVNSGTLSTMTTYSLVSVNDGSCTASLTGSAVITVNPLPTAAISGAASICEGDNANITFTGTPNAIVIYTINGGTNLSVTLDGAGSAVVNSGTLSANATYDLVDVNDGTCSAILSGSAPITVKPLPTGAINGTTIVCSGSNANIMFTGTPNAVVTYSINGGSNLTVTLDGLGSGTVNTGAITSNTTYDILSVSANGCTQTLTGSVLISVVPLPTVSISGSGAICSGQGTTITLTGTPNATVVYNANGASNTVTLDASGSATVNTGSLTTTTSYDIVSVDNGTCTELVTGNATITVSPLPTASVSGTATICSGNSANVTITGTPNATVTYNINGGTSQSVVLDGAGNATLSTGNLTSNTTYNITGVSSGLCSATLNGSAVITVNSLPTANIGGSGNICSGNSTSVFFNGTPGATITYNVNGGTPQTIVLDGTGYAAIATGPLTAFTTYTLTGAALNTCTSTLTGSASISVSPAPTVSISGSTTIAPGNNTNIQFTGTPNASVGYTVNGGPVQTIVLDGVGNAVLNSGALYYSTTYALVDVTLGCTQTASGSATVAMTIGYGPIYTYTNDAGGVYDFVTANATATNLGLSNGAVLSSAPCTMGYTAEEFHTTGFYDPATNAAVGMKVMPAVGYRLVITGFSVGVRRSADGPQYVRLAYSVDNGATWTSSGLDEQPNNSTCDDVTTLNFATMPFQVISVTDGIRFAVFGFDGTASTGQLQILNLVVNGAAVEVPLPITLSHFDATCDNDNIALTWSVDKETDVEEYHIEYSGDGTSFTTVAEQAVTQGDNLLRKDYKWVLYNATGGLYRLSSKDITGHVQLSRVVRVKCNTAIAVTPTNVYATGNTLVIRPGSDFTNDALLSIGVYNLSGQRVAVYNDVRCCPALSRELTLPQGIYMVRITQNGITSTHKILRD